MRSSVAPLLRSAFRSPLFGGGGSGVVPGVPISTTMQSSVTKGDVTWTFSAPVPVGFYPNGDPFVHNVAGVTINSCTPATQVLALDTWKLGTRQSVDLTIAGNLCTLVGHGLFEGFPIRFSGSGGGVSANRTYYVRNPTANTFQLTDSVTSSGNRWGAILTITANVSLWTVAGSRTASAFSAAGDTITCAGHKLAVNRKIIFHTLTGTSNLSTGVDYWIVGTVTTDTFQVSLAKGGSLFDITGGTGTGIFEIYGVTNRTINGEMANPGNLSPTYGGTGSLSTNHGGVAQPQAFDSIGTLDAPDGSTTQDFDGTTVIKAPGITRLVAYPRTFAAGEEVSLVKTIAMRDVWFDDLTGREAVKNMEVLTIVAAVPFVGSFRPSPSATSKAAPALRSQVNLSFLANEAIPGSPPIVETITNLPQVYNNTWMTFYTANLRTRSITPFANCGQQNYGRGFAYDLAESWQLLSLNYDLVTEKLPLAYGILQVALDHYGRSAEGGDWPGGTAAVGGGSHHVPGFATFAALALSGAPVGAGLAAWAQGNTLGGKFQAFNVDQMDVEIPRIFWTPLNGPFQPPMKGSPYFQCNYSYTSEGSVYASSSPNSIYAATVVVSNVGIINAALLSTGAQAMYNRDEWFNLTRRWYNIIPGISLNAETASPLTVHFKDTILPARVPYSPSVPTRLGIYGQGKWVWAQYDRLLDANTELNTPGDIDIDVRKNGGARELATVVSTTTVGITNQASASNQQMTVASATGIEIGHRVVNNNIPPETRVIDKVGALLTLSRNIIPASISGGAAVSFSPVVIDGFSLGILLDNTLALGDTLTMAYTVGAKPARSIANTNLTSFGATAGVNETGALPPAATTKQFVRNDLESEIYTNVASPAKTGRAWQLTTPLPVLSPNPTFDRMLLGVRMKNNEAPVGQETIFADHGASTVRFFTATAATTRLQVLGGQVRPTNAWVGRDTDGLVTTHWMRVDTSVTPGTPADAYRYQVNNVVTGQTGSLIWTVNGGLGGTWTINQLFPAGMAVWASSTGTNPGDCGIQEIFLHLSDSALPDPEDTGLNPTFLPGQDWGGNGQNVLGFAPLFYWAFNADDCNAGVTINRGSGGVRGTLYNPTGGANGGIDLEAVQPFGVL